MVEASWQLGDRLLVLVSPNLRGDDVGDLQATLGRLGFDPGRVDGIFGPNTAHAVADFQRNCGLPVDGICGPETVRVLQVLLRQTGSGPGVAAVREMASLAETRSLTELRIVVGEFGGMSGLARQIVRSLRHRGATVMASDEPDASAQAAAANRFEATVYVGFESSPGAATAIHYYQVPQFESAGGRALAERLAVTLGAALASESLPVQGMRLPVLRETRMPAVLVTVGSVHEMLDRAAGVATAVTHALDAWAQSPLAP